MSLARRLPLRFSLRTLCILPVLLALGLGWITWPAKTARKFVGLVNAERWEDAAAMLDPEVDPALIDDVREYLSGARQTEQWQVESSPRSWADLAVGRQHFKIQGAYHHLSVKRGRVVHMQIVYCFTIPFYR